MISKIETNIEVRRKAVNEIRKIFVIEKFDESPYLKGSIALLKALNKDFAELDARCKQIIEVQIRLYDKLMNISYRIGSAFEEISTIEDKILPPEKVQKMEETLEKYENIFNQRISQIEQLQVSFDLKLRFFSKYILRRKAKRFTINCPLIAILQQ